MTAWIIWSVLLMSGFFGLAALSDRHPDNPWLALLALAWLVPRFGISSSLTYIIMAIFMRTFQCPYCHEEYEAVGRWGCSCGYVDHKERHFYAFKCPMCKSFLGHTSCRRCEATIILR